MSTVRYLNVILLWCLGLLMAPRLFAQSVDLPRTPDEVIARARVLTTVKDYAGAANLLTKALDRFPTQTGLYLALAEVQEAGGLRAMTWKTDDDPTAHFRQRMNDPTFAPLAKDLFDTFGRAIMYANSVQWVQRRVDELTVYEYPALLGRNGPLALPGEPSAVTFALSDPRLPTDLRTVYQGLVTTKPLPSTPHYRLDPKYGQDATFANHPVYGNWTFPHMLLAYELDREARVWRLRFRVMWQDAPGQAEERRQLAQQTAGLLLRLSVLLRAYTGLGPRFSDDGAINVWLTEKGEAGGEAFNDNIYIYNVGVPRSATEWVREVAHEYGHETMPPVGGYVKPEWGANGLLGERLYQRWLLLNRDPSESHSWLKALDAAEIQQQRVVKLIRQFADAGPDAPATRGVDRTAMENFVGLALYLEITRGSQYLANVLNSMRSPTYLGAQGFIETLSGQEGAFQTPKNALVLLKLGTLPADLPLWVYLGDGTWKIDIDTGAVPVPLKMEIDGKPAKVGEPGVIITPPLTRGWHRVKLTVDSAADPLTVNSVKFQRQ